MCEIGNVPPHSVPVVIREIMNDLDYEVIDVLDSDSEDLSDSDEISDNYNEYGNWKVVVGSEEAQKDSDEQNAPSKDELATQTRKKYMQ